MGFDIARLYAKSSSGMAFTNLLNQLQDIVFTYIRNRNLRRVEASKIGHNQVRKGEG